MSKSKILVIQTAFIGDLLLSIPFLRNLKLIYPNSEISLVLRKGTGGLMKLFNLADQVFEVNKGDSKSYRDLKRSLVQENFDVIYCLHRSLRSNLLCLSLNGNRKIAFKNGYNWLFGFERINYDKAFPDALRQLSLLSSEKSEVKIALENFINKKGNQTQLSHPLTKDQAGWVEDLVSMDVSAQIELHKPLIRRLSEKVHLDQFKGKKRVAVFPGSVWPTKRWTEAGFRDLADQLVESGYQVVFMGSPDEKDLCDRLAEGKSHVSLAGVLRLEETMVLLSQFDLVISNDSGSMHMASAAGIPTVAIFGPTVLSIGYRPWQNRAIVVQNNSLSCRPCGLHGHNKCPIGTHDCMKTITAEKVMASVRLLKS